MRIRIAILAIFFIFTPYLTFSQTENSSTFRGIVLDTQTNEPIPSASVTVLDHGQVTRTNESGRFSFFLNSTTSRKTQIKVSCVGYKTEIQK